MNQPAPKQGAAFVEFVILMASMMSLAALSIDAMLPALPQIAADLGATGTNQSQLVIAFVFLGLATGQLFYGPVSDAIGRKRAIVIGFVLFIGGSLICQLAQDFSTVLVGRVVQGFGAAGSRIVTVAVVRDRYSGNRMAQVMSLIMTIFVLIPVVAPSLGQLILNIATWREIFLMCWLLALVIGLWFVLRLDETLPQSRRIAFSLTTISRGAAEVVRTRVSFGYALATGFVFSAFIGYLNSVQQIFQDFYGVGQLFALYFAALAGSVGTATLLNSRLVHRFGMRRLVFGAMILIIVSSALMMAVLTVVQGNPPLWLWMVYLFATFGAIGLLFGNLNAIAMEPLGHLAGIGAAVIGSMATFMCVPLGIAIGQQLDETVQPIVLGFLICGTLALISALWADGLIPTGRKKSPLESGLPGVQGTGTGL